MFETAGGSDWENVLLTTPEDEVPPMAPSKVPLLGTFIQFCQCNKQSLLLPNIAKQGEETARPKAVVFPDEKLHSQPIKAQGKKV